MQEGLLDSLPKASLAQSIRVYLSLESVPLYHGMRSRLAPATRKCGVEGAIAIIYYCYYYCYCLLCVSEPGVSTRSEFPNPE